MPKSHLRLVAPDTEKRTVGPRRLPNSAYRTREHLTEAEVERLLAAAKTNRYGHRDATMILTAFRHGLRASELVDLRWEQVEFENSVYYDYEGADWDKLMEFLLSDFQNKIYLAITDDEFYPWKLLECDKASVVHLLNQQQLFEFFIFDDSFDKIIFDTHENLLIKYVK